MKALQPEAAELAIGLAAAAARHDVDGYARLMAEVDADGGVDAADVIAASSTVLHGFVATLAVGRVTVDAVLAEVALAIARTVHGTPS